jgi:hypothetical protein
MGLYSSPGYVQAKNACFWWESCGYCGLPVDVIGKAGDFWGLPAPAKKTCINLGAKMKRRFTTEAQRHGENQDGSQRNDALFERSPLHHHAVIRPSDRGPY